jgi:hypothetical protein
LFAEIHAPISIVNAKFVTVRVLFIRKVGGGKSHLLIRPFEAANTKKLNATKMAEQW